jgi:hypothetical protein
MWKKLEKWENPRIEVIESDDASIDYYYDEERNSWVVGEILSNEKVEGQRVLMEFSHEVGGDQPVIFESVVEESLYQALEDIGVIDHVVKTKRTLVLENTSPLGLIEIGDLIKGGGIDIKRIKAEPVPEHLQDKEHIQDRRTAVNIDIFGKTRPLIG